MPIITEVMDTRDVELVARLRRHSPGRHAQHDQLRAASRGRHLQEARNAQARHVIDHRGMAAGGRVHRQPRQLRISSSASAACARSRPTRAIPSTSARSRPCSSSATCPSSPTPATAPAASQLVPPVAKAAVAAGADGLMIEVHPHPGKGPQGRRSVADPRQLRRR